MELIIQRKYKRSKFAIIAVPAIISLLVSGIQPVPAQNPEDFAKSKPLKLEGKVDLLEVCADAGIKMGARTFPCRIDKIGP
ncbi:hypothetical protein, partial [Clostridioides difficile]|uniref:hypothetical protein n=1 Tax=Clostridioides difficile TaxID=1496 RepID=UPI001A9BA809